MDWMDDGVEPRRTHDELMRIVVARGENLRSRRRRAMSLGAGGGVLCLALVLGVLTASQRASETRVSSLASSTSTTLGSAVAAVGSGPRGPLDFPLPPFVAPTTTLALLGAPPVSAVGGGAGPAVAPPTTVAGVRTPSPPAPVTTTTAPPPGLRDCTRDHLVVEATTDKALYLAGDKVVLTSTARNRSSEPCGYAGYSFESVFTDTDGKALTLRSALVADTFAIVPLAPGETLTQTREWDQQACVPGDNGDPVCSQAGPGAYRGSVRWTLPGGPYEATAGFGLAPLSIGGN